MKDRPTYHLELQADSPDDKRTIRELRHILKDLLRRYHFRCVVITEKAKSDDQQS